MKYVTLIVAAGLILTVTVTAGATTLVFDPNDIFNYATSDDTRLNQQGTARYIGGPRTDYHNIPTGRYYMTYSDAGGYGSRDTGATAAKDLTSVANILRFGGDAGYQGVNWFQLYLQGGSGSTWGEKVVLKSGSTMTPSVNGEFGWRIPTGYGNTPVYDTLLGGDPDVNQNAFSPVFNPAEKLFSVTGDFFVDENGNGVYDAGDTGLVIGQDYTIWFYARLTNWHYVDDYGNDAWGNPGYIEGTIIATAVPEPLTMLAVFTGVAGLAGYVRKRRKI
ncbi:MAG: PEP-CTERM sorting domain-containing protein [Planctomycetota bacterium]|nr:PEP-CTERM sorting domain-containing protein [Planctomycetota bacterium]